MITRLVVYLLELRIVLIERSVDGDIMLAGHGLKELDSFVELLEGVGRYGVKVIKSMLKISPI